ncbi:F-box protein At3g07870-like [Aristolochia californica]|uniref:F-box protein At3g07870-like n=1 Tax=Aristolochia californica TaxID=171875 RepID=UPI0035DB1549
MEVSLPEDILIDILSRLPKKSRFRCEVVSKDWKNLIAEFDSFPTKSTDFGFVLFMRSSSGSALKSLFYRMDDKGSLTLEDTVVFHSLLAFWNVGSCNGVIFYCNKNEKDHELDYHIYSPGTKLTTVLPRHRLFRSMEYDRYLIGLGLMPNSEGNHYRFMVTYLRHSSGANRRRFSCDLDVAIFNSETSEWKIKPAKLSDDYNDELVRLFLGRFCLGASSLCFDGSLYWVRDSYFVIFCFKTALFGLIKLPMAAYFSRGLLCESEGRLHYCQICETHGLYIWVMDEVIGTEGMWREIYHVSVTTLSSMRIQAVDSAQRFHPNSVRVCAFNEHLQVIHLQIGESLVCYDISKRTMTELPPHDASNWKFKLPFTYQKV